MTCGLILTLLSATVLAITPAAASARASSVDGAYTIYSNGVKKGKSAFTGAGTNRLTLEGDSGTGSTWHGVIEVNHGALASGSFETTGASAVKLEYRVESGKLSRAAPDGVTSAPLTAGAALYYPMSPVLLQAVLDRYHDKKNEPAEIASIDMISGKPRPVTAELNHEERRTIGGKQVRIRVWRVTSAPSPEAVVYTDETNLPLYWSAPAVQFEMVLGGYEELMPSYAYRGSVSAPEYKAHVDRDVLIPMADGVKLMADVYRPDAAGRYPVLLQRTCYDRSEFGNSDGEYFAQRGYVYVTQHVRGRGGSEGDFTPFIHESADGADTIQWCASQPWSNGKVGTLGASYNAYCEWMSAKMHPAALKAMISTVPMPGPPDGAPWSSSGVFVSGMLSWYGLLRDKARVQPFTDDMTAAINTLPLVSADEALFGKHIPDYEYWAEQPDYNDGVKRASYRDSVDTIDLPVLHVSGWLDSVGVGTRLNYMTMTGAGRKNQKLIYGPWSHFTNRESLVGNWDFGPEAYIDIKTTYLRWFDRWLKDRHNGIDQEPPVSTYLLNSHTWEQSAEWPPAAMTPQRWYLHSPPGPQYTGLLSTKPEQNDLPETYTYDPAKCIYSNKNSYSFFFGWLSGADLASLCTTVDKDRLIYQTPPLAKPMRLSGPVYGQLSAATSAKDTDWVVALVDVAPSGEALGIACGAVRARFHNSLELPELVTPNTPITYKIDMWQTGVEIPAGHRLRVVVLSTLFPDTDRNLNTGESIGHGTSMAVAHQTIYHEPDRESWVLLPVVADEAPHKVRAAR